MPPRWRGVSGWLWAVVLGIEASLFLAAPVLGDSRCPTTAPRCEPSPIEGQPATIVFNAYDDFRFLTPSATGDPSWSYRYLTYPAAGQADDLEAASVGLTAERVDVMEGATRRRIVWADGDAASVGGQQSSPDNSSYVARFDSATMGKGDAGEGFVGEMPFNASEKAQLFVHPNAKNCELVVVQWTLSANVMTVMTPSSGGGGVQLYPSADITICGTMTRVTGDTTPTALIAWITVDGVVKVVLPMTNLSTAVPFLVGETSVQVGSRASVIVGFPSCHEKKMSDIAKDNEELSAANRLLAAVNVTLRLMPRVSNASKCPFFARRCPGGYATYDVVESTDFSPLNNPTISSIAPGGGRSNGWQFSQVAYMSETQANEQSTLFTQRAFWPTPLCLGWTSLDPAAPHVVKCYQLDNVRFTRHYRQLFAHPGWQKQSVRMRWTAPSRSAFLATASSLHGTAPVNSSSLMLLPQVLARVNGTFDPRDIGEMMGSIVVNGTQQRVFRTLIDTPSFDFLVNVEPEMTIDVFLHVGVAERYDYGETGVSVAVTLLHDQPPIALVFQQQSVDDDEEATSTEGVFQRVMTLRGDTVETELCPTEAAVESCRVRFSWNASEEADTLANPSKQHGTVFVVAELAPRSPASARSWPATAGGTFVAQPNVWQYLGGACNNNDPFSCVPVPRRVRLREGGLLHWCEGPDTASVAWTSLSVSPTQRSILKPSQLYLCSKSGQIGWLRWTSPVKGVATVHTHFQIPSQTSWLGYLLVNGLLRRLVTDSMAGAKSILLPVTPGTTIDWVGQSLSSTRSCYPVDAAVSVDPHVLWVDCNAGARSCPDNVGMFNAASDYDANGTTFLPDTWLFGSRDSRASPFFRVSTAHAFGVSGISLSPPADPNCIVAVLADGVASISGVKAGRLLIHPTCGASKDVLTAVRWTQSAAVAVTPRRFRTAGITNKQHREDYTATSVVMRSEVEQLLQNQPAGLTDLGMICYCGAFEEGDVGDTIGMVSLSRDTNRFTIAFLRRLNGAMTAVVFQNVSGSTDDNGASQNSPDTDTLGADTPVSAPSLTVDVISDFPSTNTNPTFQGAFFGISGASVEAAIQPMPSGCGAGGTGLLFKVRFIPLFGLPECGRLVGLDDDGSATPLSQAASMRGCSMVNGSTPLPTVAVAPSSPSRSTAPAVHGSQQRSQRTLSSYHDATSDFSLIDNPSGVWRYGHAMVAEAHRWQPRRLFVGGRGRDPSDDAGADGEEESSLFRTRVVAFLQSGIEPPPSGTSRDDDDDTALLAWRLIGWSVRLAAAAASANATADVVKAVASSSAAIGLVTGELCGCTTGSFDGSLRVTSWRHQVSRSAAVLIMRVGAPRCDSVAGGGGMAAGGSNPAADAPILSWRSAWDGVAHVRVTARLADPRVLGLPVDAPPPRLPLAVTIFTDDVDGVNGSTRMASFVVDRSDVEPTTYSERVALWPGLRVCILATWPQSVASSSCQSSVSPRSEAVSITFDVDVDARPKERSATTSDSAFTKRRSTSSRSFSPTAELSATRFTIRRASRTIQEYPPPTSFERPSLPTAHTLPSTLLVTSRPPIIRHASVTQRSQTTSLLRGHRDHQLLSTASPAEDALSAPWYASLIGVSGGQAVVSILAVPISANKGSTLGRSARLLQCDGASPAAGEEAGAPTWDAFVWVFDQGMIPRWWLAQVTTVVATAAVAAALVWRLSVELQATTIGSSLAAVYAVLLSYYMPNVIGAATHVLTSAWAAGGERAASAICGAVCLAALSMATVCTFTSQQERGSALVSPAAATPGTSSVLRRVTKGFVAAHWVLSEGARDPATSKARRLHGCVDVSVAVGAAVFASANYTSGFQCAMGLLMTAALCAGQLVYLLRMRPLESRVDAVSAVVLVGANLAFAVLCAASLRSPSVITTEIVASAAAGVVALFYAQVAVGIADAAWRRYHRSNLPPSLSVAHPDRDNEESLGTPCLLSVPDNHSNQSDAAVRTAAGDPKPVYDASPLRNPLSPTVSS